MEEKVKSAGNLEEQYKKLHQDDRQALILENHDQLFSNNDLFKSKIQHVLKFFEKTGCNFPFFGEHYEKFFYRSLVKKELEMADLKGDENILVVGSGPFPMTALFLAEKGFRVDCVDKDEKAIISGKEVVRQKKEDLDIRFKNIRGSSVDYSDYDAVWVPLHVTPREEIVVKILRDVDVGKKVIFRNPRGLWSKIYPEIDPTVFGLKYEVKKQRIGKRSILLVKEEKGGKMTEDLSDLKVDSWQEKRCLKDLDCGEEAKILDCPDDPQLNALGLRPGKTVKTECKHPFGGPYLTSIDGRKVALDPEIVENIDCSCI